MKDEFQAQLLLVDRDRDDGSGLLVMAHNMGLVLANANICTIAGNVVGVRALVQIWARNVMNAPKLEDSEGKECWQEAASTKSKIIWSVFLG